MFAVSHGEYLPHARIKRRHILDHVRREEGRCGKDHGVSRVRRTFREHFETTPMPADAEHRLAGADVAADARQQLLDDPPVALGPGEDAILIVIATREVVDAGPRRHAIHRRAVVVAARIVDVPAEMPRGEALLLHPVGRGDQIEVGELAAERDRNREHLGIAIAGDQILKAAELLGRVAGESVGVQPFLPRAVDEDALLGSAADVRLVPAAVRQDESDFPKQLPFDAGVSVGHGNVVGGPWIFGDRVLSAARRAARLGFHLKNDELFESAVHIGATRPTGRRCLRRR